MSQLALSRIDTYKAAPLTIHDIPQELILKKVLCRLPREDAFHYSLASREMSVYVDDEYLWKRLFQRDLPARLPTEMTLGSWKDLYQAPVVTQANIKKKNAQVTPLEGHQERVTSMKWAGPVLLTGDDDGNVLVRKRDGNFETLQTIAECKDGIFQMGPTHEDLVFQQENALKILRWTNGKFEETQTLNIEGEIRSYKVGLDDLTVSTSNNSIIFRKGLGGFQESKRLEGYRLALVDGDYLFAAIGDQTVQIWKKDSHGVFQDHQTFVNEQPSTVLPSSLFFENGTLILGSFDGTIKIWKQEKTGVFKGPKIHKVGGSMNTVASYLARGDNLFVGMKKGPLAVLTKGPTGDYELQPSGESKHHTDQINALHHYENYLISGSTDGSVKIWQKGEAGTLTLLQTIVDQLDEAVTSVSMEGSQLCIGYLSGAIKLWDFFPKNRPLA